MGPSGPLLGEVSVPGDKSVTHRALILAAMARGESVVEGASPALDCRDTARAVGLLGARVEARGRRLTVTGTGPGGFAEPSGVLDCGNSGTALRLLAGAVAGRPVYAVLDGDESLRRRPMDRIVAPLRLMGAKVWGRGCDRFPPLAVKGGGLSGAEYASPVASAQVKSAVLLAALSAEGRTVFSEPSPSRDHTERMLPAFAAELHAEGNTVTLEGPQTLRATRVRVPGDASSAAFWVVGALLVPGSRLRLRGVGLNPGRTGFLEVLRRMGADLSWRVTDQWQGEPVGEIEAAHSALSGTKLGAGEVPACVDEIPILAVAAAFARGVTLIEGAAELRVKESDRLHALAAGLSAMGARVEERPDGLVIDGGHPLRGAEVESFGDHRIAMGLAVAALAAGTTIVRDTANIATSYPGFERTLARLTGR